MLDERRITDSFSAAPQIAPEDLAAIKERGFTLVVSNRPDGEEPGQADAETMRKAAEAAGLPFRHIPIAAGFPEASIADMARALDEAPGPVFAFCRSGTRSTLLWALAAASRGASADDVAEAAASAGYDIAPVRAEIERLAAIS
jgi:uncharacterized protein (TIGR01244 family)